MRSEVALNGGSINRTYTFWGNPAVLEEIVRLFCHLKDLRPKSSSL